MIYRKIHIHYYGISYFEMFVQTNLQQNLTYIFEHNRPIGFIEGTITPGGISWIIAGFCGLRLRFFITAVCVLALKASYGSQRSLEAGHHRATAATTNARSVSVSVEVRFDPLSLIKSSAILLRLSQTLAYSDIFLPLVKRLDSGEDRRPCALIWATTPRGVLTDQHVTYSQHQESSPRLTLPFKPHNMIQHTFTTKLNLCGQLTETQTDLSP